MQAPQPRGICDPDRRIIRRPQKLRNKDPLPMMDQHDKTEPQLDALLQDLLAGIAEEPVSDELRALALRLQKQLDQRQTAAITKT